MKYVPRHQEIEAEIGTTQEGGKLALIKWQDGSLTTMVPGLFDLLFMEKPSPVVPVKTEKCTKCGDWFTCSACMHSTNAGAAKQDRRNEHNGDTRTHFTSHHRLDLRRLVLLPREDRESKVVCNATEICEESKLGEFIFKQMILNARSLGVTLQWNTWEECPPKLQAIYINTARDVLTMQRKERMQR